MFRNCKRLRLMPPALLAVVFVLASIAQAGKPDKPPRDPPPEPEPLPTFSYTSLGTLGGHYSIVNGMNEQGDVVGYSMTAENRQHAFLSTTDGHGNRLPMVDLNDLIDPGSGWYLQSAVDGEGQRQTLGRLDEGQAGQGNAPTGQSRPPDAPRGRADRPDHRGVATDRLLAAERQ